jgi:hypothetical protein
VANRRATRIYLSADTTATYAALLTDAAIRGVYSRAQNAAGGASGQSIGPVKAGQLYAFQTADATPRYGVILIVSVPVSTSTTTTTGLQMQVRMAKQ